MSAEERDDELAKLRRENAELSQKCERLIWTIKAMFPIPTEAELADAEANPGQLTRFIDSLAAELGVVEDGR